MSKKKRHQHAPQQNSVESLKRQLQKDGWTAKYRPISADAKGRKISETFLEFIKPFQSSTDTTASYEKLVITGVIAWNAALVTGVERQKMLDIAVQSIVDQAGETWRKDAEDALALLIRHKERAFAADRRFIVDYRLTDMGTAYHLAMAAVEPS